jgi:hypothetical protein
MSAHLSANTNTSVYSKQNMYLSMALTFVLSTDIQNCHDYNAFQLPNATAQCEQIDMSHHHESCISRFLLLRGWAQGQLVLRYPLGQRKTGKPSMAKRSTWTLVYTEDYSDSNKIICLQNFGLKVSARAQPYTWICYRAIWQ